MGKFIDLTGQTFHRLTVIGRAEDYIAPSGKHYIQWRCVCNCENKTIINVLGTYLRNGHTKSCGCLCKEMTSKANKKYNNYDLTSKEYGVGYTDKGEEFYFDKEDYDLIKNIKWHIYNGGYVRGRDCVNNQSIQMHRLIANCQDGLVVDHIDHNPSNNTKKNLRICTQSVNMQNLSKRNDNSSNCTGVSWCKEAKQWESYININKKRVHLGYFKDKQDAINTRLKAQQEYFNDLKPNIGEKIYE